MARGHRRSPFGVAIPDTPKVQRIWAGGDSIKLFEVFVLSEKTALEEPRVGLQGDIQSNGHISGR
jgi:hypothetical protein